MSVGAVISVSVSVVLLGVMVFGFVSVSREEKRQALRGLYPCRLCHHEWVHAAGKPCDECKSRLNSYGRR